MCLDRDRFTMDMVTIALLVIRDISPNIFRRCIQMCLSSKSFSTYALNDFLQLFEVGHMCGLMPDETPTSQQLNLACNLCGGVGKDKEGA